VGREFRGWRVHEYRPVSPVAGAVLVAAQGYFANVSAVVYLNGTTDSTSLSIVNFSGGTVTGEVVKMTWSKIP
jgi:hypothetical protein